MYNVSWCAQDIRMCGVHAGAVGSVVPPRLQDAIANASIPVFYAKEREGEGALAVINEPIRK